MKPQHYLLWSTLSAIAYAGPARRDCGVTKTFEAFNLCGDSYGGTYIECAAGVLDIPTFTMPSCFLTPEETAPVEPVWETDVPLITPAPDLLDNNDTAGCRAQWVCVDAIASCGDEGKRYGSCFNTCTDKGVLSTPPCTVQAQAKPTNAPWSNHTHHEKEEKAPDRETKPQCIAKPFLCAPAGW
ncbi:hypothetical protein BDU57DRAFT_531252 [Ampelomyces quisqualis]|uniref:Uncharacterized protein n=1 Tax=Ampelomyces quisqualis TaxID=50730 RepID=A0A6A5QHF3_AMPQU|nr:hypothetical protein BDU57DRAFT_531252 [Ampelomyces quisqualis]